MKLKIVTAAVLLMGSVFNTACNNSSDNTGKQTAAIPVNDSVINYSKQIEANEKMKADIEAVAGGLAKKEIELSKTIANEAIKQEWFKMDVYSDSSGVRRIKLYPHPGVSQRSKEYYYNNGKMFFTFISDSGLTNENKDEGTPGKEFHFMGEKLIKYDEKSGDKETNTAEEKKMYEATLPLQAEELYSIAAAK